MLQVRQFWKQLLEQRKAANTPGRVARRILNELCTDWQQQRQRQQEVPDDSSGFSAILRHQEANNKVGMRMLDCILTSK